MKVRPVDERDSEWESDLLDFRVFLYREGHVHEVFDIDQVAFCEAHDWATRYTSEALSYGIAMRTANSFGRPGLVWLIGG